MSVVVTLETPELDVDPGSSRDVVVKIRNNGVFVDKFAITILGDSAPWTSVTPPAVNIYPDTEESVRVSFAPPRKSVPHARRYVYGVFVQSTEHPDDAATEEGAVTVLPFTATTAELVPQTSRGSGRVRHEVGVKNGGNVAVEAQIVASDPDRLLQFETRPDRLALEPGASGTAKVSISPVDTFLTGPPQSRQFGVTINSSGQDPFELRGAMLQSARLPNWLPRAVAGIAALAVVGGVMAATGTFPPRPTPSPSGTAVAQATLTPTPLPTPTPTPEATPSDQPSAPPSPTPTPGLGEFELAPIPDPSITNGALLPKEDCDLSPGATCYQSAVDTLTLMAGSLGGPFGGDGGVVSRNSLKVGSNLTIPIIVDREGPFQWAAQDGATVGQTPYIVIDLAPLIAEVPSFAYAVVQTTRDDALAKRFLVDDNLAHLLLETVYTVNEGMVDPGPLRSFPPIFETFEPPRLDWSFEINPS